MESILYFLLHFFILTTSFSFISCRTWFTMMVFQLICLPCLCIPSSHLPDRTSGLHSALSDCPLSPDLWVVDLFYPPATPSPIYRQYPQPLILPSVSLDFKASGLASFVFSIVPTLLHVILFPVQVKDCDLMRTLHLQNVIIQANSSSRNIHVNLF